MFFLGIQTSVFVLRGLRVEHTPLLLKSSQRHVRAKICKVSLLFRMFLKSCFIHETMLSLIFHLSVSFTSRRLAKPLISTVFRRAQKNTSIISRKPTENRITKRMGLDENGMKTAKSTVFGRLPAVVIGHFFSFHFI